MDLSDGEGGNPITPYKKYRICTNGLTVGLTVPCVGATKDNHFSYYVIMFILKFTSYSSDLDGS